MIIKIILFDGRTVSGGMVSFSLKDIPARNTIKLIFRFILQMLSY